MSTHGPYGSPLSLYHTRPRPSPRSRPHPLPPSMFPPGRSLLPYIYNARTVRARGSEWRRGGGWRAIYLQKVPLWTKRIDDENARPAARASKPEEIGAEHGPHGRPFLPFWNGYCAINIGRETSDSRGGSASEARAFHQGTRKTRPPLPNPTSSPPELTSSLHKLDERERERDGILRANPAHKHVHFPECTSSLYCVL